MALTRDFSETVVERAQRDREFAEALLNEAVSLLLNGEPEPARLMLRDLVIAAVGFDELATALGKSVRSLQRMLGPKGNPSMDSLMVILEAVRRKLKVGFEVRTVARAS